MKQSKYYLYTVIILLGGWLSSCEQENFLTGDDGDNSSLLTNELVAVNFTLRENYFYPRSTLRKDVIPSEDLEGVSSILISSLSGESEDTLFAHAILKEEVAPVNLRASLLTDSKVRIIAYANSGSGYIDNVGYADYEITAGGAFIPDGTPPMVIPAGTYKFVAYSYHNTNTMPLFADTTMATGSLDLLWGGNIVPVGPGNNTVYILLEHLFSQVKLQATINHAFGSMIYDLEATVSHTNPKLDILTPDLIAGSIIQIPFGKPLGGASIWNSSYQQIFTAGNLPVVTISSVDIDGTTYGPFPPIYYMTPLAPGYEYTLYIYFTTDGILCGDLEYPASDTWGNY